MNPFYEDGRVTLYLGDALELARALPSGSVGCIVTSPPYYGLRDYGADGQIGAEPSVGEYVARMGDLFGELLRVLADDGTLWLNLGDTYAPNWSSKRPRGGAGFTDSDRHRVTREPGVAPKNLLGIPWRVAFALQDRGWVLRSDIIWAKPNPMPESVQDRPTKSHEHVFLFSKSDRYHYDAAAIAEPATGKPAGNGFDRPRARGPEDRGNPTRWTPKSWRDRDYDQSMLPEAMQQNGKKGRPSGPVTAPDIDTRNARDVWTIGTVPFPGAHFAVFPPELPRRCIRAGARGGSTVLDPFSGSGTTGQVALMEGHPYIGFDLNPEYLQLSLRTRFAQQPLDLGGDP